MSAMDEVHPIAILLVILLSGLTGLLMIGTAGLVVGPVIGLLLFELTVTDVETER
ncbi:hypothetical protein HWV07_15340 [Natronomonas salina]|uniref:hypothetical protein n=1 Tax=Natronomonas salina TaxID=1710540 RepID=UPI0015B51966|nr:hypothetical protein [Natronomonas salina]QLD90334.1 hypothetical protein HWV07_15340 [Natronomonas salina]